MKLSNRNKRIRRDIDTWNTSCMMQASFTGYMTKEDHVQDCYHPDFWTTSIDVINAIHMSLITTFKKAA